MQKLLSKQGLKFTLGAAVSKVETKGGKATVTYKLRKDDSEQSAEADVVLVATGRKPYTDGLGLDALGIATTDRGQIKTDGHWQTSVKGIYAIASGESQVTQPVSMRESVWLSTGISLAATIFCTVCQTLSSSSLRT